MLGIEDGGEYLGHRLRGSAHVENLVVARLRGKIVNLAVDGVDTLAVELTLAAQDSVGWSREEHIVVKRGDKAFAEIIKEAGGQIDAAAAAVADNVGVVAVENHQAGDARHRLHAQEVAQHIVNRVVEQPRQRACQPGAAG